MQVPRGRRCRGGWRARRRRRVEGDVFREAVAVARPLALDRHEGRVARAPRKNASRLIARVGSLAVRRIARGNSFATHLVVRRGSMRALSPPRPCRALRMPVGPAVAPGLLARRRRRVFQVDPVQLAVPTSPGVLLKLQVGVLLKLHAVARHVRRARLGGTRGARCSTRGKCAGRRVWSPHYHEPSSLRARMNARLQRHVQVGAGPAALGSAPPARPRARGCLRRACGRPSAVHANQLVARGLGEEGARCGGPGVAGRCEGGAPGYKARLEM